MSVERLNDGRYRLRWFENGTKKSRFRQETLPRGTDRKEAERIYKRRLAAAAEKKARGESFERMTFKTLALRYLEEHGPSMAESSLERTRATLELHLFPVFGSRPVETLRALDVKSWQRKRAEVAKPATVNREFHIIRAVLNWGEAMELIDRNPVRRGAVKPLAEDNIRTEFFEPEEWARFLGAFFDAQRWNEHLEALRATQGMRIDTQGRDHGSGARLPDSDASAVYLERLRETVPVFRALFYTAARLGELIALTWDQIDLRRGLVSVYQQKTRATKTLPMGAGMLEILRGMPAGIGKAPVFTRSTGASFYKGELQRAFALALRMAGIEKPLSPHSIRHTVGSWLAIAGVGDRHIAEILGHKQQSITAKRYAHLTSDALRPAVALLEKIEAEGLPGSGDGSTVTSDGYADAHRGSPNGL